MRTHPQTETDDSYIGYPFIQLFYNTTNSLAGTNIMTLVVILTLTSSAIAEVATASRQIWSFARDRGIPGYRWVAHVSPKSNIPLNAVMLSLLVTSLLSLINIGSTVALIAIISLTVVSLLTSYIITIVVVLLRRVRGQSLPARRFNLGKAGMPVNIIALCYLGPIFVLSVRISPFHLSDTLLTTPPVLPSHSRSRPHDHELVHYHVRRHHVHCHHLLHRRRPQNLPATRRSGQARRRQQVAGEQRQARGALAHHPARRAFATCMGVCRRLFRGLDCLKEGRNACVSSHIGGLDRRREYAQMHSVLPSTLRRGHAFLSLSLPCPSLSLLPSHLSKQDGQRMRSRRYLYPPFLQTTLLLLH